MRASNVCGSCLPVVPARRLRHTTTTTAAAAATTTASFISGLPTIGVIIKTINKKNPKKLWARADMTLEESWRCRPSVWIVPSVYGKGQSAPALTCFFSFVESGASPLTPPQQLIGRISAGLFIPSLQLLCVCVVYACVCVHAARRGLAAIAALNDHVGRDND